MRPILTPQAEADLSSSHEWYEDQRRGLGDEFLLAVEDQLRRIAEHPALYPVLRAGVRRALVRRFPYAVFYLVEEERLVVLAVDHQARHPDHWRERLAGQEGP